MPDLLLSSSVSMNVPIHLPLTSAPKIDRVKRSEVKSSFIRLFYPSKVDGAAVFFTGHFGASLSLEMIVDELERKVDTEFFGLDIERELVAVNLSVDDRQLLRGVGSGCPGYGVSVLLENQEHAFVLAFFGVVDERASPLAADVGC
jgi:hypothetical protein